MENVLLTIHLILALFLIGAVLLQRSEGGAIFGSGGGLITARGATTALSKVTWGLAIAFIVTSIVLTGVAANRAASDRLLEGVTAPVPADQPVPADLLKLPPAPAPAPVPATTAPAPAPATPVPDAPLPAAPAPIAPAPSQ
jgi:preprotein translocase subunit SecG